MKKENRIQSAAVFVRCALYARALSEGGADAVPSDQVNTHSSQSKCMRTFDLKVLRCTVTSLKTGDRRCDFIWCEHVNEPFLCPEIDRRLAQRARPPPNNDPG